MARSLPLMVFACFAALSAQAQYSTNKTSSQLHSTDDGSGDWNSGNSRLYLKGVNSSNNGDDDAGNVFIRNTFYNYIDPNTRQLGSTFSTSMYGMSFFTNNYERMRIAYDGRVGIGMPNASKAPAEELHIYSSGNAGLELETAGTNSNHINFRNSNGYWHVSGPRDDDDGFRFYWNNGSAFSKIFTLNTNKDALIHGQLGIGIPDGEAPTSPITVMANDGTLPTENGILCYQTDVDKKAIIAARSAGDGSGDPFFSLDINGEAGWSMGIDNDDDNNFKIASDWQQLHHRTYLTIAYDNGNMGIGVTNPGERLTVSGNVSATGSVLATGINTTGDITTGGNLNVGSGTVYADKVAVTAGTFPDYVFAADYDLMPLHEVEAYINTHQHLPKFPSAEEVLANGQDLGHLNMLLTEKVEELTLHTIAQEKQLNSQQQQLANQANDIAELNAMVQALVQNK